MSKVRCGFRRFFDERAGVVRRFVAYVMVVAMAFLGFCDDYYDDRREAERDKVTALEMAERRIVARGGDFGDCQESNAKNRRDDAAYQSVFAPGFATGDRAKLSRILDNLRAGLNEKDCEVVLADLSPADAAKAREYARSFPTKPLPPPTIPGYVPVGGAVD